MFTANMLNRTQQVAVTEVVTSTQDLLGRQSLIILGRDSFNYFIRYWY
jgi:hypothetical protein